MTEGSRQEQDAPLRLRVAASGRTDVGRVRGHNEDRLLVRPGLGLFVVADGMGGHNAGEVASALATVSVENFFLATESAPIPGELGEVGASLAPGAKRLVAAVTKANGDVFEISRTHREHKGMGTTIVAVHASTRPGEIHIAHVGDSRCYRVRAGEIEQLTRDHSLVSDAKEWKPNITEAELAALPKNVISRALGRAAKVQVDVRSEALRAGDVYVLCSDGLSGMVEDPLIRDVVEMEPELGEVCDTLVALANDAGGADNVTVLALRVEVDDPGEPAAISARPIGMDELAEVLGDDAKLFAAADAWCKACGAGLAANVTFCGGCGASV